jgi:ABC-2 type transport system ATP-binding protein/sodium transport system ATP-binding protein
MIVVHELFKQFPGEAGPVTAVDRVSFTVGTGEVYGLLGPNGAGKTTTMRMILGLLRADGGFAEIGGERSDRNPDEVKRRVGFISASAGIYQWLTPREMLMFFAEVYGWQAAQIPARIDYLADLLDFRKFLDRRSATLSTGQKQRVNLARALVHDPPVMIMDEPTLGLDIVGCKAIFDYIELLKSTGKSLILCTHQLDQAERVCDRFGLLFQSRLVREGTLDQLLAHSGCEHLVDLFIHLIDPRTELDSGAEITHSQSATSNPGSFR